jgi:hypothetical protein
MFNITNSKGFQITFANGYTVSVQFGYGNYCENRYGKNGAESANAEVAAFKSHGGEWVRLGEHDNVIGHQTPDQVLGIMAMIATLPKED